MKPSVVFFIVLGISVCSLAFNLNSHFFLLNEISNCSLLLTYELYKKCEILEYGFFQFACVYGLFALNTCNVFAILFLSSYTQYRISFALLSIALSCGVTIAYFLWKYAAKRFRT